MRTRVIAITVGVVFLFGCSHTSSAVPQPKIVQSGQSHIDLSPDGSPRQYSNLHSFVGGSDGEFPQATVVKDASGNLYGATLNGGGAANCGQFGCGVVFKIDVNGHETVLHSFNGPDGAGPAGLIVDGAGNLFGTAQAGGSSNYGVVFELDPSGNETVLHSFSGADGFDPGGGVIRDTAGNLYGTAVAGGSSNLGVVFEVKANGHETALHSFNGTGGMFPNGGLVMNATGILFGTTHRGGATNHGVVFKIDANGHETVLHSFGGGTGAGKEPLAGLYRDAAGNLFGTTQLAGGPCSCGVVFELSH